MGSELRFEKFNRRLLTLCRAAMIALTEREVYRLFFSRGRETDLVLS
jgi:hypothetical protein